MMQQWGIGSEWIGAGLGLANTLHEPEFLPAPRRRCYPNDVDLLDRAASDDYDRQIGFRW